MHAPQFNARLHPDTLTKIKQLASVIGNRNTPASDLSQAQVVTLAVNLLHLQELGQSGKVRKKHSKMLDSV
jgi:hypothetical protein